MTDLRGRARGQQGQQQGQGSQVARREAETELAGALDRMMPQLALAMPKGVEARQLVRDAMTLVMQTPALLSVDRWTFQGGLMTCAQLGLRPGVLGQAWLLPFKRKAQFVAGYKGLTTLAHRSGQIAGITNEIIRARDVWDVEHGTDQRIIHKPGRGRPEDPAALEPVAYYAIVRTINGGRHTFLMERWQVEEHRDRFALQREWNESTGRRDGPIKGPWVEHFDAMALKTVLKYALRTAPLTLELQQAVRADETVRFYDPSDPVAPIEAQIIDPDTIADDDPRVDPTQQEGWPDRG